MDEELSSMMEGNNCLDKLPVELLLLIFSYLDAPYIIKILRLVCKRFNDILSDEFFWKKKIMSSLRNKTFPSAVVLGLTQNVWRSESSIGSDVSWLDLSYHIEKEAKVWNSPSELLTTKTYSSPHYAAIDTVKLLNDGKLCVTGGRDRLLVLWDLVNETDFPLACNAKCHTGWIWDTTACEKERFFTCGWDSLVVHWSLANGSLQEVTRYNVERPAMCIDCQPGLVVVGLNVPKVTLFDPRVDIRNLFTYFIHRHVITDVAIVDNKVYSSSEDKTLGVFDLRMMAPIQPNVDVTNDSVSFPRCIAHKRNLLWIGDSRGVIRLYDVYNNNKLVQEFCNGNGLLITSLWAGIGTVITGSIDRKVRVYTTTHPVTLNAELSFGGEVTSIDYESETLAVASTDNSIRIYKTHSALDALLK